jgi:hypothetical protein
MRAFVSDKVNNMRSDLTEQKDIHA